MTFGDIIDPPSHYWWIFSIGTYHYKTKVFLESRGDAAKTRMAGDDKVVRIYVMMAIFMIAFGLIGAIFWS